MDMFEIAHELETRNTKLITEVDYLRSNILNMEKELRALENELATMKANHQSSIDYYDKKCDEYEAEEEYHRNMYRDQDLGPVW